MVMSYKKYILHVFCHSVYVQPPEPFPLQKQLHRMKENQYLQNVHIDRSSSSPKTSSSIYLHGFPSIVALTHRQARHNVLRLHARLPKILNMMVKSHDDCSFANERRRYCQFNKKVKVTFVMRLPPMENPTEITWNCSYAKNSQSTCWVYLANFFEI